MTEKERVVPASGDPAAFRTLGANGAIQASLIRTCYDSGAD